MSDFWEQWASETLSYANLDADPAWRDHYEIAAAGGEA